MHKEYLVQQLHILYLLYLLLGKKNVSMRISQRIYIIDIEKVKQQQQQKVLKNAAVVIRIHRHFYSVASKDSH